MQNTQKTSRRIYARRKTPKAILLILLLAFFSFLVILFTTRWTYQQFFMRNTNNILNPYIHLITLDEVQKRVKEKGYKIESVKGYASNSIVSIKLKNGPEVLFALESNLNLAINVMDEIIKKLTIDNKKPKLIDLRFDKPIVKL